MWADDNNLKSVVRSLRYIIGAMDIIQGGGLMVIPQLWGVWGDKTSSPPSTRGIIYIGIVEVVQHWFEVHFLHVSLEKVNCGAHVSDRNGSRS